MSINPRKLTSLLSHKAITWNVAKLNCKENKLCSSPWIWKCTAMSKIFFNPDLIFTVLFANNHCMSIFSPSSSCSSVLYLSLPPSFSLRLFHWQSHTNISYLTRTWHRYKQIVINKVNPQSIANVNWCKRWLGRILIWQQFITV